MKALGRSAPRREPSAKGSHKRIKAHAVACAFLDRPELCDGVAPSRGGRA